MEKRAALFMSLQPTSVLHFPSPDHTCQKRQEKMYSKEINKAGQKENKNETEGGMLTKGRRGETRT